MGFRCVLQLYLVKNPKIVHNSTTTKASEKISTYLESLEFFDVCLTKFKNNQILLNKISHRFLRTTKLLLGERIYGETASFKVNLRKAQMKRYLRFCYLLDFFGSSTLSRTWRSIHNTLFSFNLQMGPISWSVCPWKTFLA